MHSKDQEGASPFNACEVEDEVDDDVHVGGPSPSNTLEKCVDNCKNTFKGFFEGKDQTYTYVIAGLGVALIVTIIIIIAMMMKRPREVHRRTRPVRTFT